MKKFISTDKIESKIFQIRGKRIMLDSDLAELYEVHTKVLLQSVKRNLKRFPEDFMFRLTSEEMANLRSQIVTSRWGGRRYLPFVFTQEGVAMLSSILNSERAIFVNIQIMRVFVGLRRAAVTYAGLKRKIDDMEEKYDGQFAIVFQAIKKLLEPPPEPSKRRIGFHHDL
ncbi:MAG: ORF6N domain-containing protein [Candidatus Omnitrophota bacterium]|nr:ORF6N domain-containing protein [Candidatus Omnitrophota bacterium]